METNDTEPSSLFYVMMSDRRSSAPYFVISLISVTIGNFLLHTVRKFVNENQYAVLTDRLESLLLLTVMVFNVYASFSWTLLWIIDNPSPIICAIFTITMRQIYILVVIICLQATIIRVLYMTVWKNIGAINDDFFMLFFKITSITFSVLYGLNLAFFKTYETYPNYWLCHRKRDSSFIPSVQADLGQILVGLTWLLGHISVFILIRERKKLHKLHMESRLASGLPRIGETHQGVHEFISFLLAYVAGSVFLSLHFLFRGFFISGDIDKFPYSGSYVIGQWVVGLHASFVHPLVKMWKNKRFCNFFIRQLQGLTDF